MLLHIKRCPVLYIHRFITTSRMLRSLPSVRTRSAGRPIMPPTSLRSDAAVRHISQGQPARQQLTALRWLQAVWTRKIGRSNPDASDRSFIDTDHAASESTKVVARTRRGVLKELHHERAARSGAYFRTSHLARELQVRSPHRACSLAHELQLLQAHPNPKLGESRPFPNGSGLHRSDWTNFFTAEPCPGASSSSRRRKAQRHPNGVPGGANPSIVPAFYVQQREWQAKAAAIERSAQLEAQARATVGGIDPAILDRAAQPAADSAGSPRLSLVHHITRAQVQELYRLAVAAGQRSDPDKVAQLIDRYERQPAAPGPSANVPLSMCGGAWSSDPAGGTCSSGDACWF
jgi:hypothetical protein